MLLLLPFMFVQGVLAQGQITGQVTETETGDPLVGATVLVKGTNQGVFTDAEGNFSIRAGGDVTLAISFVGFEAQDVPVNGRSVINVSLDPSESTLDEVVVIGYGTQGRSKVTNAITKVDAEEISALPVVSAEQALQGRAAGVTVINNGSPGRGATIRIRGMNSVNANDPLFVIDGVPAGGLNEINPEDIESIEVAKDASAAAIYGSRASGGVVFITTKKGKGGAPTVSFDGYYGVQNAVNTFDLLNTQQYIEYATEIQENAGLPVPPRFSDPAFLDGSSPVNINNEVDYMDEIFRSAPIQDYNVSISGGDQNGNYYVSGGYLNQQGVMLNTDFERYSFRTNTNFKKGKISFGQTLNLAYSRRNNEAGSGQNRSLIEHATKAAPYMPVEIDGTFKGPDQVDNNDAENPVRIQELNTNFNETLKLLGNFYVDYEILDGLNLRQTVGIDMAFGNSFSFSPAFQDGEFHGRGFAETNQTRSDFISPISTTTLNFDRDFGAHNVTALAGYEVQYSRSRNINGQGQNDVTSDLQTLNSFANDNVNGNNAEDQLISLFGRIGYSYANKYIIQASVRRDGYSRFGPANKFGLFPSVSAGWNIHEESFMEGVSALSTLKLRGSWGETGNAFALGRYEFQPTVNLNFNYGFGGNLAQGGAITALANPNLAWERQQMLNLGLDFGLLNDQLTFSAEFYDNTTRDMLLTVNLPSSMGFTGSPRANTGEVRSSGVEFTLGYASDPTQDFSYAINGNFATQANELVSLGLGNPLFARTYEGDPLKRSVEGEPLYHFFGWEVDRLFQASDFSTVDGALVLNDGIPTQAAAQPGDIKFRDLAGPPDENGDLTAPDGVIDANDRVSLGNAQPTFIYGLNADFRYKNFELTLFFQGQGGNYIYNANRFELEGMTRVFNAGVAVLDRWTPTNTETDVPRGVTGDPNRNARASTRFLERGDFLRAKLVRFGYTFDTSSLTWASRLHLYVAAQNLFTITNYTGLDPEIGTRQGLDANTGLGLDFGQYPQARTFMVGVNANF
ncbi:MAG: TonB-dependent receptor [Bacteroidota bacterium]